MTHSPEDQPIDTAVTCTHLNDRMMAYLYGQMPPQLMRAYHHHVDHCDQCAREVASTRQLIAELRASGAARQSRLSDEASQRIQENVYRQMRRALWRQRVVGTLQMAGAAAMVLVFVALVALMGNQWLAFLAAPDAMETAEVETAVSTPPALSAESLPDPAAIAPLPPDEPAPVRVVQVFRPAIASITPGQTPAQVAAALIETAVSGNDTRLENLLAGMAANRAPTLRLWQQYGDRCTERQNLRFETFPHFTHPMVRVDIYEGDAYLGEIKMRQFDGEWFAVFSNVPSIMGCLPRP